MKESGLMNFSKKKKVNKKLKKEMTRHLFLKG